MRTVIPWVVVAALGLGAAAARAAEVSVTAAPLRHVSVDGDSGKFREMHWVNDGYSGGISDFALHHTFGNGVALEAGGHALIANNDFRTDLALQQEGVGFLRLDFTEFRKYFDGNGGVYHLFPTLGAPDTDRELHLDIGKLGLEAGLTLEGWPELTFLYEREYKDGTKSKLSWGEAEETPAGISNRTRNIVPTWMEIDEIVDVFELGAAEEVGGTALSVDQHWEFVKTETLRQETDTATTGTAADYLIKTQNLQPEVRQMTTTLRAERGFQDERVRATSAYRFGHLVGREFETIFALAGLTGLPTATQHAHTGANNIAHSTADSHTWVGNVATTLSEELTAVTSLKAEMFRRDADSFTNADEALPLGVNESTTWSWANSRANRWAETTSLRYTGVPRTALYTDLELEQIKVHLVEEQTSGSVWLRDTVLHARRGMWTLGGNFAPWPALNVTAQVRRRVSNQDPDDQRETQGSLNSAFVDTQRIHRNEATTRVTYKPCRWFRSSVRYQYMGEEYATAVQAQNLVKTDMTSHTYTYDVSVEPLNDLLLTGALTRQTMVTITPARHAATATDNIPSFHGDVNTWQFSADYTPSPRLALLGNLLYTTARNFNDFTANGMPYGTDFNQIDLTTGLDWTMDEDTSVNAEYGFYYYQANSNAGTGDYNAHMISLEVAKKF